jgi:enoyl-CoA hydratase
VIDREERDGVVVLKLNHGKASALDVELLERLCTELDEAEAEGAPIVITGTGRIFSAGVDLFRVLDGGTPYLNHFLEALERSLRRLFTYSRPLVAAVNGHAIAGGWVVACTADYKIVVDGPAKLGVPELKVGVAFPVFPLEVVREATPAHLISSMVLAGRLFSGDEALLLGLADEVIPAARVVDRACEVAAEMGAIDPTAFSLAKRQLRAPALDRIRRFADIETAARHLWTSEGTRTRIREYLESTVGKS